MLEVSDLSVRCGRHLALETVSLSVAGGEIVVVLGANGAGVLLVEQNTHQSLAIADRAYLLEKGAVIRQGTAAELKSNEAVQKAYLGM